MKSSDDCRAYAAEAFALSQAMLDFSQASNFQRNFFYNLAGIPANLFLSLLLSGILRIHVVVCCSNSLVLQDLFPAGRTAVLWHNVLCLRSPRFRFLMSFSVVHHDLCL